MGKNKTTINKGNASVDKRLKINKTPRVLHIYKPKTTISDHHKITSSIIDGNNKLLVDPPPTPLPFPAVSIQGLSSNIVNASVSAPKEPMLANPIKSINKLKTLNYNDYYGEEKYDGERVLVQLWRHSNSDELNVKFYSRNLKIMDINLPYNEIKLDPNVISCVLDGERLFKDYSSGKIVKFCNTGSRSQYMNVVCLFDIQELNGVSTMDMSLVERKEKLKFIINQNSNYMYLSEYTTYKSYDDMMDNFNRIVNIEGGEGLMLKLKNSLYVPNMRNSWLKVKKLHILEMKEEHELYAYRFIRDVNGMYGILDCGLYDNENHYHHVTMVSSGLSRERRHALIQLLDNHKTGFFTQKHVVISVSYDCITAKRSLRHPAIQNIRTDIVPKPYENSPFYAL